MNKPEPDNQLIGYVLSPEDFRNIVDILKELPWKSVAGAMKILEKSSGLYDKPVGGDETTD